MDCIKRAILFGAKAIVTVLDTRELVQTAIGIHGWTDPVARAMGRALTMTAFMSGNFKSQGNTLTVLIQGNGPIGKMVLCGDYGARVRGYCENPQAAADTPDLSVRQTVGERGSLNVIKDFGMKKPYNGLSELVNGNIDSDFAYYFTVSEQLPSAVALGCEVKGGTCLSAGGVIVQAMPNCSEDLLVILQDVMRNFSEIGTMLQERTPSQILDDYFGHFEIRVLDDILPRWECNCSNERIERMLLTLGRQEAEAIVREQGTIEVGCDFCKKQYRYNAQQIQELFDGAKA